MNPTIKQHGGWALKILGVILPALVTGYFSYRSAMHESKARVQQAQAHAEIVKNQAAAGYEILLKAIDRLSATAAENGKEVAELKGRLDGIWASMSRRHGGLGHAGGGRAPASAPDAGDLKTPSIFKKALPKNLDSAYEMRQQESLDF